MNDIVCNAIRARRLLRFVYDGYERIIEPHIHGINTANHEMVSGWLVGGWTATNAEQGWRNYLVREMADLHALAEEFPRPRPGYKANDRGYGQVFCRLEVAAADGVAEGTRAPLADRPAPDDGAPASGVPSADSDRGPDDRATDGG